MLYFKENWFFENISDDSVAIDGFGSPFRCHRDCDVTDKKRGCGVCMDNHETWCPRSKATATSKQLFFPVFYHVYNHMQIHYNLHTRETREQIKEH